ncbi:PREDICTED: leucine-rich repeat receptor protein kinase EXS-like [Fragaria vesca subsp. vesca]
MWMKQIISPSTRQLAKGKMSKPSHRVMLTKLFFYLNFLFWQHLGTQLKFQARADAVQPAANGTTTTVEPLLPQNEVSTLTDVIFKLGVDSPSNITRTYCTLPIPTNGISIRCNCSYKQNTECHIRSISLYKSGLTAVIPEEVGALRYLTDLDLSNSKLQGPIPAALGDLYDLEYLDLSRNQLTGSIPDLGSLRNLRFL